MSSFVPIRSASAFSAGIVGGSTEAIVKPSETVSAESDGESQDESLEPGLPESKEALAALLDEARQEARSSSEAVLAQARLEIQAQRDQLERLLAQMDGARAAWTAEVRNVLGELVVAGVRSVVSESAELQEDMLRDRFAVIGERLIGEQQVTIRVRSEDLDAARDLIGDRDGWTVVTDDSVSGGLVAESEGGRIDASLGSAVTGLADSVQSWQDEGTE